MSTIVPNYNRSSRKRPPTREFEKVVATRAGNLQVSRICKFLLMVQKITRTSLFSFTSAKISLQTFPAKTFKARLEERGLRFNSSRVLVNKPNPARKFVPFRVKTNNPAVSNLKAIPTGNSSFYWKPAIAGKNIGATVEYRAILKP